MKTLAVALSKRLSPACLAEVIDSLLSVWDDADALDGSVMPDDEVDAATDLFHALCAASPQAATIAGNGSAGYTPAKVLLTACPNCGHFGCDLNCPQGGD